VEYTDQMKNRLKRVQGQIRGILKMMEEEKDCKDVITQLTAAKNALESTIGLVVSTNLEQCLRKDSESPEKYVNEAIRLLIKSRT